MGSLNEAGLIIYSVFHDRFSKEIAELQKKGVHCMAILRPLAGLDCVRMDHRMVGILQALYVADAGYRKILYIGIEGVGYG